MTIAAMPDSLTWGEHGEVLQRIQSEYLLLASDHLGAILGLLGHRGRAGDKELVRLFQGLRTTFSCVFEGFSRELSSHYIINTNCNALYSPIHYRKVANM